METNKEEALDSHIKESAFAKMGVHRPYTVFVCIMAILILGVFAFSTLKTELFPKMDLPYAAIMLSVDQNQLEPPDTTDLQNLAAVAELLGPDAAALMAEFTVNQKQIIATILSHAGDDFSADPLAEQKQKWIAFAGNMSKMTTQNSAKLATDVASALSTVSGIKHIESISMSGAAIMMLEYSDGVQPDVAELMLAINNGVGNKLDNGTYELVYSQPMIMKLDPSIMPVFSFTAKIDDAAGLTAEWYEDTLLTKLRQQTDGVGSISSKFENASAANNMAWLGNSNGVNESLSFSIQKQATAVTTDAVKNIIASLEELKKDYPGFDYIPVLNQGEYIDLTLGSVGENLIIGGILAIIILFLFLRSIKMTIAIAISIPLSVVATFVFMYFMGIGLNIVSMSALALAVGMLVDNSVVVLENIYRLRQKGLSIKESAIKGASQIMGAMFASTLTTICVFLPMFFLTGFMMKIFLDLVWVVILSLTCSLVVAIMFLPAIISSFKIGTNERKEVKEKKDWRWWAACKKAYSNTLNFAINKKWWTIAIATVVFAGSICLMFINGFTLMPPTDEGEFTASVTFKSDVKIEEALVESTYKEIEDTLGRDLDNVLIEYNTGLSMSTVMGGGGGANTLSLSVSLKDNHKISTEKAAEKVYNALIALDNVDDVSYSAGGMMGALVASNITIYLQTNETNPITAHTKLEKVMDAVSAKFIDGEGNILVKGITDVENGYSAETIMQVDKRVVAGITLQVSADANISNVQAEVDRIVAALFDANEGNIFDGVTKLEDGFAAQMNETYTSLVIAIIVGLLLVYLVMVAIFQSFLMPAIILICIPLAFTGAFLLLAICGMPLSVPALVGFLILMGVIVNNGILAVDYTNQARADGLNVKEALVAAMHTRMRPIFMTALTTIIGLLPMALGFSFFNPGSGGAMMQPLAIVSIGGMLYGTMTTLLVVPAFYAIFCRDKKQKTEVAVEAQPEVAPAPVEPTVEPVKKQTKKAKI